MARQQFWPSRPAPPLQDGAWTLGRWELRAPSDVTFCRTALRAAITGSGETAGSGDAAGGDDVVERLLLTFEELASNGCRHGHPPVEATVSAVPGGWLVLVSDAAVDRYPFVDRGRDPGTGGLGLYLVARVSAAHGWCVRGQRKEVWAWLTAAPAA